MTYQIVRKPNMNRLYITGDAMAIRGLLSDFRARFDGDRGYWLPLHREAKFRAALETEAQHQANLAAELAAWEHAKSVIPADYKTRHGAMYGGRVTISGTGGTESFDEPAMDTRNLPWSQIATHGTRVRDLTGQSSINGRVMDSDTLYSAVMADGRTIYRIAHCGSFGDDMRETYYLPEDVWQAVCIAEIRGRGITRAKAEAWLAEYRGCVGTELYEFAVTLQPAPETSSAGSATIDAA